MTLRQRIANKQVTLSFGKYKGKPISEVLRIQPSYILWLHEEGIVEFSEDIVIEEEELEEDEQLNYWGGYDY